LGSERAGECFPSRAVGFGGFCAVHGWAAWGGGLAALVAWAPLGGYASIGRRFSTPHPPPSTLSPNYNTNTTRWGCGIPSAGLAVVVVAPRLPRSPGTPPCRQPSTSPAAIILMLDMDTLWQVSPPASVAHGCPSGRLAESCCRLMPQRYPSAALGRATGPLASHLSPPLSIARLW
jgi:hypothetical protein